MWSTSRLQQKYNPAEWNLVACISELRRINIMTLHEANKLIDYHYEAMNEKVYGERFFNALCDLERKGRITEQDVEKLYMLSVDAPLN